MADAPTPPAPPTPPEPPAAPDKPSPERRFVQKTVQSFIQWMPLGGSGFLFASFLLKQEWAQVMLAFPVTIVTAVWAAYSKNFIERLSEIYAEKGKQDADRLNKGMDSLNEALKWQFSGFDAKYLKLQAKPCQEYTTEGFNPDKTTIPMLEEVFVPVELSGYFEADELAIEERKRLARHDTLPRNDHSIWDFIRRSRSQPTFRQIAIQAQGGFGKTTLMRHIALIYGQGKHRRYNAPQLIPFLLYLRDWRNELAQPELPTLPNLITQHYLPKLSQSQPLQPPPQWVETLLHQGKALVMLDGFDELAEGQRERVSHWISQQMQEYDRTTFIVTSRPTGFKDYVAKRPTAPLFVKKFSPKQQALFINQWYLCQERCARSEKYAKQAAEAAERKAHQLLTQLQDPTRPELREMAQNPLLLTMLTTFHRFDPGTELPKRRIELYRGICKLQLEDRPKARGIPMLLSLEKSQQVLQALAMAMVQGNTPSISHQSLLSFLQTHPTLEQEEIAPEDFLKQMVQVSELWVEREPGEYEFPHLSFQGYFAASALAQQTNAEALALIRENWDKAWWRETILLYTAQLPPKLMTHVLGQASTFGSGAAQLAYDCLREYRNPEKLDPAWEQQLKALTSNVQNLRYQQLEAYLQAQDWKAADQETYRLMITTVGKDVGQWFEREELLNFPCEELRAMDGLWVKYSNGLFGFSVQKKIYVECGAKLDGKYPGDKIWEAFGDRVGWRMDNQWIDSTTDLTTPSPSSPQGFFPSCVGGGWGWLLMVGGVTLFSHRDL